MYPHPVILNRGNIIKASNDKYKKGYFFLDGDILWQSDNLLEKSRKKSLLSFKFLIGRAWIVCISTKYPNPIQYSAWYISNPMLTQMKRNFKNSFGHNVRLTESCKSSTKKKSHTPFTQIPQMLLFCTATSAFSFYLHTHIIYTLWIYILMFPQNKDILIHKHNMPIKIRKLKMIPYYRPFSNFPNCSNHVLHRNKNPTRVLYPAGTSSVTPSLEGPTTGTFLKSTGQSLCSMFFNLGLSHVSSWLDSD